MASFHYRRQRDVVTKTLQRRTLLPLWFLLLLLIALALQQHFIFVSSSSGSSSSTETLIGIVGKDFVLLASDSSISASSGGGIAFTKSSNVDKIYPIVNPKISVPSLPFVLKSSSSSSSSLIQQQQPNGLDEDKDKYNDGNDNDVELIQQQEQQRQTDEVQVVVVPRVAVAAVGDPADIDRLIHLLQSHAKLYEYESTDVGCDIQYIDWRTISKKRRSRMSDTISNAAGDDDDDDDGDRVVSKRLAESDDRHDRQNQIPSAPPTTTTTMNTMFVLDDKEDEQEVIPKITTTTTTTTTTYNVQQLFSVHSVASLARATIAQRLRTNSPWNVALLVGGMVPIMTPVDTSTTASPSTMETLPEQPAIQQQEQQLKSSSIATSIRKQLFARLGPTDNTPISTSLNTFVDTPMEQQQQSEQQHHIQESPKVQLLRPCLYWLDEYGSIQGGDASGEGDTSSTSSSSSHSYSTSLPYAVHGLGSYFLWSILDQYYYDTISKNDAIQLIHLCYQQLRTRYIVNTQSSPITIKCIDQYGIHTIQ